MAKKITMNADETLELDYLVEQVSDDAIGVASEPDNVSTSIDYISTRTGVFNPPDTGTYQLNINGQTIKIEVIDIPDSAIAQFDAQSSFEGEGGSSTSTFPDLISGNDLTGDSVSIVSNGINSYPALDYNRQQQESDSVPVSTPFTTITVFRNDDTGDTGGDEDTAYGHYLAPEYNLDKGGTWAVTGTDGEINSGLEPTGVRIVTVVWDSNSTRHRVLSFDSDGNLSLEFEDAANILSSLDTSGWALGGDYDGSGDSDITVGEQVIYNTSLSSDTYQSEESRLAKKWS